MRTYTNSSTVVHHEDGSWTETSEVTHLPATKKEKAIAYSVLGVLALAPAIPLLTVVGMEKASIRLDAYRAKREAKKSKK